VFARWSDGSVRCISQSPTPVPTGWGALTNLGGTLQDGLLTAARNEDGRLEVFAKDGQRGVAQLADGSERAVHCLDVVGWTDHRSAAGRGQRRWRLEIFARGVDSGLWHTWQVAPEQRLGRMGLASAASSTTCSV